MKHTLIKLKKAVSIAILAVAFASPALAAPTMIKVEGRGATEQEAIDDAYANAIAATRGMIVDTETVVEKDKLVKDRVSKTSFSHIKKFQKYSTTHTNDGRGVIVKAFAVVDGNPAQIKSQKAPGTHGNLPDIPEQKIETAIQSTKQAKSHVAFINEAFSDNEKQLREGYRFELEGVQTTSTNQYGVSGYYIVSVAPQKAYWDKYRELFNTVPAPRSGSAEVVGLIGHDRDYSEFLNHEDDTCFASYSPYLVPKYIAEAEREALEPFIAWVRIGNSSRQVLIFKNAVAVSNDRSGHYYTHDKPINDSLHRSYQKAHHRRDHLIYTNQSLMMTCTPTPTLMSGYHKRDKEGAVYSLPRIKERMGITEWSGSRLMLDTSKLEYAAIAQIGDHEPVLKFKVWFKNLNPERLNDANELFKVGVFDLNAKELTQTVQYQHVPMYRR